MPCRRPNAIARYQQPQQQPQPQQQQVTDIGRNDVTVRQTADSTTFALNGPLADGFARAAAKSFCNLLAPVERSVAAPRQPAQQPARPARQDVLCRDDGKCTRHGCSFKHVKQHTTAQKGRPPIRKSENSRNVTSESDASVDEVRLLREKVEHQNRQIIDYMNDTDDLRKAVENQKGDIKSLTEAVNYLLREVKELKASRGNAGSGE